METHRLSPDHFMSIVEAGIQGPSADNRHPLLFDQGSDSVRVWGNDEFCTAPFHRRVLFLIALGAVVENMALRARSLGFHIAVSWFPDVGKPRFAAELKVTGAGATADELAWAIPHRQTNRRFFHGPPMLAAQRDKLERDATAIAGTRLIWLDQQPLRSKALRLIRVAETERFRCRHLHQELFSSIRFEVGWKNVADQGLSPGSLEIEWPLRGAFTALQRWGLMHSLACLGAHHLLGFRAGDAPCRFSPHLGAIATTLDIEPGALAVGQAFERVWLRATSYSMALQPMAASTLLALDGYQEVRPLMRQKLACGWAELTPGMHPLIVFRLGWSSPASLRSGRRPVEAYLR
jgi:hypothetical protein